MPYIFWITVAIVSFACYSMAAKNKSSLAEDGRLLLVIIVGVLLMFQIIFRNIFAVTVEIYDSKIFGLTVIYFSVLIIFGAFCIKEYIWNLIEQKKHWECQYRKLKDESNHTKCIRNDCV